MHLILLGDSFSSSGNIGYATGGSDVVRAAGLHDYSNDYDDEPGADEPLTQKGARKDSPPSYDGHCKLLVAHTFVHPSCFAL